MRYWLRVDNTDYSISGDDMSLNGYAEVSKRPDEYPEIWEYDFDIYAWVINKTRYVKMLADQRYKQEILGITTGGKTYDSDDRARVSLMALIVYGQESYPFKTKDYVYETLTLDEVKALFNKVMGYTLACFEREKVLREKAEAGEMSLGLLVVGWPNPDLDAPPPEPEVEEPVDPNPSPLG